MPIVFAQPEGTAVTYATWNPADKGTNTSLSNGDLTALVGGLNMVRSTIAKSSGKWYWEITMDDAPYTLCGIALATANLETYPGGSVGSWGYYQGNGNKYKDGASSPYSTGYSTGNVVGVALDMDAGQITMYVNGTSRGLMYSGISGNVYAAYGRGNSAGSNSATVNFGATSFAHTVPGGFNAGLYE